jgi:hypothetical protein
VTPYIGRPPEIGIEAALARLRAVGSVVPQLEAAAEVA